MLVSHSGQIPAEAISTIEKKYLNWQLLYAISAANSQLFFQKIIKQLIIVTWPILPDFVGRRGWLSCQFCKDYTKSWQSNYCFADLMQIRLEPCMNMLEREKPNFSKRKKTKTFESQVVPTKND